MISKLDAAEDPAALLERLRRLASAPPSSHAHALRRVLAGFETIANAPRPGIPEPLWLRLEPWDPGEPLPALELLARTGGALGLTRDPLAKQLADHLVAGGMEDLEAAHLGWQMGGIVMAVQWVWAQSGASLPGGEDSPWQMSLQEVQRIGEMARQVLERHSSDFLPPGPHFLRV